MKIFPLAFAAIATLFMAGCAEAPTDIPPQYVSSVPYLDMTCRQLGDERLHLADQLVAASEQQDNARTDDTIGVLLVGLPTASMSGGDVAPQIALLKGEAQAVRQAEYRNRCG